MASHPGIVVSAITWNLFHGRDFPPEPELFTWRSRLTGAEERGATHAQVNVSLREHFAAMLAGFDWEVALLQEAPPRWFRPLAEAARASGALALTSRNVLPALQGALAERNPDLIASWEGGSNVVLVRAPGRILETLRVTLARRPERRRLLLARLELRPGRRVCVANMHLSAGLPPRAAREAQAAAERALDWADGDPLLFGGDLNLRPDRTPEAFEVLRGRFGLAPASGARTIDHLMTGGLDVVEAPLPLPAELREFARPDGLRVRLSDHAPVTARFGMR